MTRKDYQIIAKALRETMPILDMQMRVQWKASVDSIADALAVENPNFNYTLFKQACGLPE